MSSSWKLPSFAAAVTSPSLGTSAHMGPGGEKSSGSCPHIQSRSLGDSGMLLCALKSDYSTHPASGKAAAIATQAEMWYTEQEGTKHSNKLCCMLACPSLAHGNIRPHQARLWVVPRSTCCPAACEALPAPLLTPEAGAATGRFWLGNGGAAYVVWATQYVGLLSLMEMSYLFLCKMS